MRAELQNMKAPLEEKQEKSAIKISNDLGAGAHGAAVHHVESGRVVRVYPPCVDRAVRLHTSNRGCLGLRGLIHLDATAIPRHERHEADQIEHDDRLQD